MVRVLRKDYDIYIILISIFILYIIFYYDDIIIKKFIVLSTTRFYVLPSACVNGSVSCTKELCPAGIHIHTCIICTIHMYNTHGVYICLGLLDVCICHYVCLLPICIYTGCVYNETLYTHQQFFSDGPCIEWYAV